MRGASRFMKCKQLWRLVVSREECLDELDVSLLGVFLGGTLLCVPCVPLGLALEVEHAWAFGVCVTNEALLVKCVDL